MNSDNNYSPHTATFSLVGFSCFLLFLYCFAYRPFVFEAYLPPAIRIGLEGFLLLFLTILNVRYSYYRGIVWLFPIFIIYSAAILIGPNALVKVISSFNKLTFLILAICLLTGNRAILDASIRTWLRLSYLLSAVAIIAFMGFVSGAIPFSPLDLGESTSGVQGSYYYLHNPLLGNLIPRRIFEFEFGRVAGYMFEGQMLGSFFGISILGASNWIMDPKERKIFVAMNIVAGLFTLSTSFFLFFSTYLFILMTRNNLFKKINLKGVLAIIIFITVVIIVISSGYAGQTSGTDRMDRILLYFSVYEDFIPITLLFGHGVGITLDLFQIGIDSGWVSILMEHGLIMLIFMSIMLASFTRRNPWLMIYVFFLGIPMNMFWDPIFLLFIAMTYSYSIHEKGKLSPSVMEHRLPDNHSHA